MTGWRRWILIFFLLVILPLGVYGLYANYRDGKSGTLRINEDLVRPYARLVKGGQLTEAYQRYTSEEFKRNCSLDAFLKAQDENKAEFGRLAELALKENAPFKSSFNLFAWKTYYQGGLVYRGDKGEAWTTWVVIEEDDALKMDASYQLFHNRLKPRVF